METSKPVGLDDLFHPESCDFCGLCLEGCPELNLTREEGGDVIRRLVEGEYISGVLDRCTNCMNCDALCPTGARPYELIVYRWFERYREKGIPPVFLGAVPFRDGPNVWSKLEKWYTEREREEVRRWREPEGAREMLFLGCNQQYTPYIVHSRLFEGLPVFSDRSYCCGEPVFRLGMLEDARRCALRLKRRLEELGVERLIAFCPSCYNTMTNLTPNAFGIRYGVEIVDLTRWLQSRLDAGEIDVSNPLDMTVTIQDGCHGTGIGEDFLRANRDILARLGLTVKEMEHTGGGMRCCGLGAAAARYRLSDVLKQGIGRLREAKGTGADAVSAYCNGCYFTMNMIKLAYPVTPPVYHMVELVQKAMGEKPERRIGLRRIEILMAAAEAVGLDLPRRKRVWLPEVRVQ